MSVGYRNAPRDYYQHDNRRGAGGGPQRGGGRPGRYQNHRKPTGGRGYLKGNFPYSDADGDICMDEEPRDAGRFAPYAKPGYSQARGGLRRGRGRGGPGGGDYGAGGSRGNLSSHGRLQQRIPDERSWNKVIIPYGRRYEKNFIMKALTQACPIPFIPVNYHTDGNSAVFYVEDHEAAAALRQLNQKLSTPNGQKMSIVVRPSPAPLGTIPRESIEHVKSCMSRRHDHINRILDLSSFHADDVLKEEGHFLPLYRQAVAFNAVEALEENYRDIVVLNLSGNKMKSLDVFGPCINKLKQLKALNLAENSLKKSELERLKGLPIEEISLRKNPFLSDFTLQAELVDFLRKIFPKLLRLDGELLPPLILFDLEGTASIPDTLGSFYISGEARDVAVQFIQQYITMYDSDCRKGLIDAYHEGAMFVLAAHKPSTGTNLHEYIRTSRDLLRVPDMERRLRYLYRGKHDIVDCLQRLPSTQHDPDNLVVDVCVAMPSIMTITLSGIFKELTSKTVGDLRAFSRTWVLVPNGSGFNIINETLFVTNATSEQVRKAFKTSTAAASISPIPPASVPTISAFLTSSADAQQTLKQEMLASFCQQSGMNTHWALKCLEDNKWDYEKAAGMFREINAIGSIPAEAFVH